ncbi:TadE/TadG family type IV pilus assembly protein [Bacillus sp. FJAT-29937]|uniref:TadE/TadG family type IV pilus assembly protein n=1 Tax=Bacillus sp. FJAT-29937 TaxID=1720553 RepID=UPI00082D02B5|nr:pilus assembly protein [Bacillus sp. FJAT-29937]
MLMNKKMLREEKGSMTLEFLMVLPYYFFFFLLLWQVVASGITFMKAQSAVNEAAKVYSITADIDEAKIKAKEILGSSDMMTFKDFYIDPPHSSDDFKATIEFDHGFVFIPKQWRKDAAIENISLNVHSKVIK